MSFIKWKTLMVEKINKTQSHTKIRTKNKVNTKNYTHESYLLLLEAF